MTTDKILEDIRDELRRMNGTLDRMETQQSARRVVFVKIEALIQSFISGLGQMLSEWKARERR